MWVALHHWYTATHTSVPLMSCWMIFGLLKLLWFPREGREGRPIYAGGHILRPDRYSGRAHPVITSAGPLSSGRGCERRSRPLIARRCAVPRRAFCSEAGNGSNRYQLQYRPEGRGNTPVCIGGAAVGAGYCRTFPLRIDFTADERELLPALALLSDRTPSCFSTASPCISA